MLGFLVRNKAHLLLGKYRNIWHLTVGHLSRIGRPRYLFAPDHVQWTIILHAAAYSSRSDP